MPYKIYLKKNEEKRIVAGHSWVYANEVAKIEGKEKNGSLAEVCDNDGKYIGKGYINHASKILVRIFIRNGASDDENLYLERIKAADDARKKLGYDNCYRVVFGEADNLPALIVDKYGDYLAVQLLSLGMDQRRKLITDCLVKLFNPKGIYERSDVSVRKKEGLAEIKQTLYGEVPDYCEIYENGLKMFVDIKNGQKTGYFLDQKENRLAVRKYCKGEILDCFCNSGGFTLNAATVADKVTACDISAQALENVKLNAIENGLDGNIETVCGDAFEILRQYRKENRKFDAVILDPPAFCKTADEVKDAYRGYKDINLTAMKLIKDGGYLITCSCSHYMTFTLFEKMLIECARESGKTVRSVEIKTQSPDHPSLLCADETQYLKFFVLQITDKN